MNLKFINTIVFVNDIRVSKAFYAETLRLQVIEIGKPFNWVGKDKMDCGMIFSRYRKGYQNDRTSTHTR